MRSAPYTNPKQPSPTSDMNQTRGTLNMLKMTIKCVFKCQNHCKMKSYHLPVIKWNHLCCSGGYCCCWPGWTSEQTPTVKYLNSCMQPLRTQDTRKYKYLCSIYFIHLISLSGRCRCQAFAVWVLHLWPDCVTENQPVPTMCRFCLLGFFLLLFLGFF